MSHRLLKVLTNASHEDTMFYLRIVLYLGLDPSRYYSITSLTHCKVKLFSLNS